MQRPFANPEFHVASSAGRICGVAGQVQRDLQECASRSGDPFTAKPFDATLFSTLSLAIAFGSPTLSAKELRAAGRAALWVFGLDWRIDYLARSASDVEATVRKCLAVADGKNPDGSDGLVTLLADIRNELRTVDDLDAVQPVWRDELDHLLASQSREWHWKASSALPSFDEYVANADNVGFSFVYVVHLMTTCPRLPPGDMGRLREAGAAVQRVIRLLNDLGTYERDRLWGDLNSVMVAPSRAEVDQRLTVLSAEAAELIDPIRGTYPGLASYLERQMGFCAGLYEISDFWGTL